MAQSTKFVPGRGLPAKHEIGSLQNLTGLFAIGQSLEQKAEKPLLHLSQLKNKFFRKFHNGSMSSECIQRELKMGYNKSIKKLRQR